MPESPEKETVAQTNSQPLARSVILFTICRYVVYTMTFARGLTAARHLGPYLLGVYGFLILMQNYLSYTGFGTQYAINVELATRKDSDHREIISTAITLTVLVGLILCLLGLVVQVFHLPIFEKFSFQQYALLTCLITGATSLQYVFTNIYRIHGRLARIATVELFGAAVLLLITLIYRGETLVFALLAGLFASAMFANVLYLVRAPFTFTIGLTSKSVRALLALGLPLLIYNASFLLITIAAQSVVSIFYPLETIGYYTLASQISNAALLGFNSIAWVAFPLVLGKTRMDVSDEDAARATDRVNVVFGTSVFLIVFAAILALPLVFLLLPKYEPSRGAVTVLLLAQALLMSSYGYDCLAIARHKQLSIANASIASAIVVAGLAVLAGKAHAPFVWVAIAVLAGSVLFTVLQARIGLRLIRGSKLRPIVPWGSMTSVGLCLGGVLLLHPVVGALLGAATYLVTNKARVLELWQLCQPHIRGLMHSAGPAVEEHV
jgi:O-antigen/teichoic acid export membrane protein